MGFVEIASLRILYGLLNTLKTILLGAGFFIWDLLLFLCNLVMPDKPADDVVPAGWPGAHGLWPDYVPPKEGDSRCACPALNAMANHGIIARSGRDVTFSELRTAIRKTYNFAPSMSLLLPVGAANFLNRDYSTGKMDLSDINAHNCIEHDASFFREDIAIVTDQSVKALPYINDFLANGTGPGGNVTAADMSRFSGKRRVDAQKMNSQFSLSTFLKLFGSSNAAFMLDIFGGKAKDLHALLLEERLAEGWQPQNRHPMGMTFLEFALIVLKVELGIAEEVRPPVASVRANDKKAA